ncbi:MAG: hypothetical protein JST62_05605 [Bacteroidetes bacterium]|nr:hypothetical protein [Bacteroidota bacterium]
MKFPFFTSEEKHFNEVLFQGRNKSYGAYVIRNEEAITLRNALLSGLSLVAVASVIPFIFNFFQPKISNIDNGEDIFVFKNIPIKEERVSRVLPPKTSFQNPVKSKTSEIVTPKKDITKEVTVQDVLPTTTTSNNATEITNVATNNLTGNRDVFVPPTLPTPLPPAKVDVEEISTKVDVEAEFVGGINQFRNQFSKKFDATNFENSDETLQAIATFVVEKDGTMSTIKIKGKNAKFNQESERVLKNILGKWTPAKIGGKSVRSYFSFPISMSFE